MGKRKLEDEISYVGQRRPSKRAKHGSKQNVLELSNELILRILSFLSTSDLIKCERVSRKFRDLAIDNEIWREKFFVQFVRPRARRIPGMNSLNSHDREKGVLNYSSKAAKWLEHSHLTPTDTDWKRVYKVKSNWTRGVARTTEVVIKAKSSPSVLAKVYRGIIYTVDDLHGLRSWRRSKLLHTLDLNSSSAPTAVALHSGETAPKLAIGFADGSVSLIFADEQGAFTTLDKLDSLVSGAVSSLALAWPYLLSLSSNQTMTLHCVTTDRSPSSTRLQAKCLANLRSNAEHGPKALSLRRLKASVIASVVYPFYRFNAGWCFGLQELRLGLEGHFMSSRLTSTVEAPIMSHETCAESIGQRSQQEFGRSLGSEILSRSTASEPFVLHPQFTYPPNTISFSGCYVLAGLPDNTLMLYTVNSTDDHLEISSGRRLWGHTSAVAAAEVTSNGKALSISAKSDEMRYWELEDLLNACSPKRTSTPIKSWTDVNTAIAQRGNGLGLALQDVKREFELTRKWVGFDEEQAVILGERDKRQILSCFDFA